jgi:hypothetical protein
MSEYEIGKISKCSEISDNDIEEYERNNSMANELDGPYSFCFDNKEMVEIIDENVDEIIFNIQCHNNDCRCKCCYEKCKCSFKYYKFKLNKPTYYDFCVKFNELTRNFKTKCYHRFVEGLSKNIDGTYDVGYFGS